MNSPMHQNAKMVAHEMRSSLAAIDSALRLLKVHVSDEAAVDDLRGRMERQLNHLTRLVTDLGGASSASALFELRKERTDLVPIAHCAVDTLHPLMERFGHTLITQFPSAVPVEGDPGRLVQVLINLLENAAWYTPQGGEIRISVEQCPSEAIVRVEDNGVGIPSVLLPNIFDMYVRGTTQKRTRIGGMGVGLAIARAIVETHGGSITASSGGAGKGSTFVVRLLNSPGDHAASAALSLA